MQINHNYKLTGLNTLHLQSIASEYIAFNDLEQLESIANHLNKTKNKFFILGGGSNIILPKIYSGTVIHNQLLGIEVIKKDNSHAYLRVMAGENWDNFVSYSVNNGYYGLENLSLIPGTVGASPIQNIGAYGVEVKDFIESVEAYDINSGKLVSFSNKECNFVYRNSYFKNNTNFIVTAVFFKLNLYENLNTAYADLKKELYQISDNPKALDLRNCVIKIRQSKLPDPAIIGNAGSFFHNPIMPMEKAKTLKEKYPNLPLYELADGLAKVSAGWLIDNLGLKGYKKGRVGVYDKQALVLVNHDNASIDDLLDLADYIKNKVANNYDINLNIEPILI